MSGRPTSLLAALARSHLRRRPERAVFAVVAGAADRWWSSDEVARAAGVDNLAADQALRRFAAVGIVDGVSGEPRRFRYGASMAYLERDGTQAIDGEHRDPVCGMPVPPHSPHSATGPDGGVARFCSAVCLALWRREQRHRQAAAVPTDPAIGPYR